MFCGAPAGQTDVADAARRGIALAEVGFQHGAPAAGFVGGVVEHVFETFAHQLLTPFVGVGRDVEVGAGKPLLVHEEDRRAVGGDVADHAQLPEPFEQLLDPLDGVAAPRGDLALVDLAEFGEDAVVKAQQRAEEVVEFVTLDADAVEIVAAYAEHDPRRVFLRVGQRHVAVLLQELERALHRAGVEVLAGAEVVDVEQKRSFGAVADADLQVGADLFVDVLDLFEWRKFLLETLYDAPSVVGGGQQQGVAAHAVAACAAGLLIVAFERIAHGVVGDEPHVGFVDAHAEGVGGDHHARPARDPLLLPQRAFGMPHAPMVGRGRYALPAQHVGDLLGAFARTDVDDARAGDVAYQAQQLPVLVVGVADAVRKVGTCEAAPQDMRFGEPQVAHDVFGHEFRGRGRERQHRDAG